MVDFKVVLSDPATGKAYNIDASGAGAGSFIGKRIGEEIDGAALGFDGYKIRITGASDRNGTPARKTLQIAGRQGPHGRRCRISPTCRWRASEENGPWCRDHPGLCSD